MKQMPPKESTTAGIIGKQQELILEAARLVRPESIGIYENSETANPYDELLLLHSRDPKRADDVMKEIGRFLRRGTQSLSFWRTANHAPEIASEAQMILADIVMQLQDQGVVKIAKSPEKIGKVFADRWKVLRQDNSHRSDYAVIPVFALRLYMKAQFRFCEIGLTPESELPPLKNFEHAMLKLSKAMVFQNDELTEEAALEIQERMLRWQFDYFARNVETFEMMWQGILWPMAKEIWPNFAREHEHFVGYGKHKLGLPLSNRKRSVDEKTDFGIARHESAIKREVERDLMQQRASEGDGGPLSVAKAK